MERKLAETWQELLGFDKVGAHDDFFDLGGDSLLSVDMMSRIRREFEIDLTTDSLLEGTTVAALAAVIEEALLEKLETPGRHGTMSAD